MASNYWIKLYHEMLDDPKVGRLSDSQFRLMVNLFLLAGDCEQDGYLPEIEDVRWRLRSPENFDADIESLKACGVLEYEDNTLVVSKFAERQGAMTETERQQKRRERLRKQEYYCHEPVTNRDTDKEEDKDIDKDIDKEEDTSLFSTLSQVFIEKTQLPEGTGGFNNYAEALQNMVNAGITPDVLGQAIDIMNEKGYTIKSPSSCYNTCLNIMQKKPPKKQGNPSAYQTMKAIIEQEAANGI